VFIEFKCTQNGRRFGDFGNLLANDPPNLCSPIFFFRNPLFFWLLLGTLEALRSNIDSLLGEDSKSK
jgi:hypothetical protein